MILAFDVSDLPGDAIGVLLLLLISLFSWLKNRFSKPEEDPELFDEEEERMREIVWRRQIGEGDDRAPWETDPTVWHPSTAPPPPLPEPPPLPATPPPRPVPSAKAPGFEEPKIRKVSERERRLSEAFEHRTGPRPRRSRSPLEEALRSPGTTRQAILLAEILGPPLALREPGERRP